MSIGEGSFGLPSPRRHGTRASRALVTTTPRLKDILDIAAAQQAESPLQRRAVPPSRVFGTFHRTS
jgi:hypothetical protein